MNRQINSIPTKKYNANLKPRQFLGNKLKASTLALAIVATLQMAPVVVDADPVVRLPMPNTYLPRVFCFRITDIAEVLDADGKVIEGSFKFMFEILNWADKSATGLQLMKIEDPRDVGEQPDPTRPLFNGFSVDAQGRPLGSNNDNLNFPPSDGTSSKFKFGQANKWFVAGSSATSVYFMQQDSADVIPPRNLIGATVIGSLQGTTAACNLVPGCRVTGLDTFGREVLPVVSNPETVDNGAMSIDGKADNVLDGFVMEIKNFHEGDTIAFNWFMMDEDGKSIGSSGFGNDMGYGSFNMTRLNSDESNNCSQLETEADFKECLLIERQEANVGDRDLDPENGGGDINPDLPTDGSNTKRGNSTRKGETTVIVGNTGYTQDIRDMFVHATLRGAEFAVEPAPQLTAPFAKKADNTLNAQINATFIKDRYRDCEIYFVQDTDLNDSQFYKIPTSDARKINTLGPVYPGFDMEGFDMHPKTQELYATSGNDTSSEHPHGYLYKVDWENGNVKPIGMTGFDEVSAISFHPNGVLWGWAKGKGLIQINKSSGVGTMFAESGVPIEDLTWSYDGNILYGVQNTTLYKYEEGKLSVACDNFPSESEGIDILRDNNTLVFGLHDENDTNIHVYDIRTCSIDSSITIETPADDIEGITWMCKAPE